MTRVDLHDRQDLVARAAALNLEFGVSIALGSRPATPRTRRRERAQRSEPRDRSEAPERRARERVGESEGRSPSDKVGCGGLQPAVLAAVERGGMTRN